MCLVYCLYIPGLRSFFLIPVHQGPAAATAPQMEPLLQHFILRARCFYLGNPRSGNSDFAFNSLYYAANVANVSLQVFFESPFSLRNQVHTEIKPSLKCTIDKR